MFLRVSYRVGGGCILSHNNLSINIATVLIKSCGMTLLLLLNFSLPFRPLPSSRPIFVCLKQSKTVWQKPGRTRLINLHSSYSLQVIKLNNVGEDPLTWALDCAGVERLEDGTFKFVHPTGTPFIPPTPSSPQPTEGQIGFLKPGRNFEFTVQCKPGVRVCGGGGMRVCVCISTTMRDTPTNSVPSKSLQ